MPRLFELLHGWRASSWAAGITALVAAGAYGLQAWGHAHGQASVLDEGLYLYKGWLYASGRYWPFQDYGPWTNHMPLSFLIPGWVQLMAGPGLRTGRMYALVLTALLLLAVWILARRLGGRWLAAAALAALALNPFLIKIYSQAISQVLVAAMLAWALVLTLGPGRRRWALILGGAVAGALVMTRINMLPVLPLLVGYIFWEHGRRAGWMAAAAGAAVVLAGHAIFWPGILKLWAYWLPGSLTPFLDPWRELSDALPFWNPGVGPGARLGVFLSGIQRHLFSFAGVLLAGLCWPERTPETRSERRTAGILLSIFLSLLAVHAWAALGQNYCVFCYPLYLGFFSFCGILLLALVVGQWLGRASRTRLILAGMGALLVVVLGRPDTLKRMSSLILTTQLPRMKALRLLPGSASLEVLLANRFGLDPVGLREVVGTLLTVWLGLLTLGALAFFAAMAFRRSSGLRLLRWVAPVAGVWLAGLSLVHGNTFINYDCGTDVIASYEASGAHLRSQIPGDASVYWAGGLSPVPLLYLPKAQIFPAQLNGDYSYRIGGDPASLDRFGFWNAAMAESWLGQADFALVEQGEFSGWLAEVVASERFEELPATPLAVGCRADSSIRIFRRVQ